MTLLISGLYIACMVLMVKLFVIAGSPSSIGSWLYSLFLVVIFSRMILTRRFSKYRRIGTSVFTLLFALSYIWTMVDNYGSILLGEAAVLSGTIPFNPFLLPVLPLYLIFSRSLPFSAVITGGVLSVTGLALIWSMAAITIGKGWCSWVCPFGGYEDFFSRIRKKPLIHLDGFANRLHITNTWFAAIVVLLSVLCVIPVYIYYLNPFSLITGFYNTGGLIGLGITAFLVILFICLVVILPLLTKKRFQCISYCPLGALQTLVSRAACVRTVIDVDACDQCMKCVYECRFSAIDEASIQSRKPMVLSSCAHCGECIEACPNKAIRFEYSFVRSGTTKPPAQSRFARLVQSLIDPQRVYVFSAFVFFVFFSSPFATDALNRIIACIGGLV